MNRGTDDLRRRRHEQLCHLQSRLIRLEDLGKRRDGRERKLGELGSEHVRQVERSVYGHSISQREEGITQQRHRRTTGHSRKVCILEDAQTRADGRGGGKLGGRGADDGGIEVVLDGVERVEEVGGSVGSEVDEEGNEEGSKGRLGLGSPLADGRHDRSTGGGLVEDDPAHTKVRQPRNDETEGVEQQDEASPLFIDRETR